MQHIIFCAACSTLHIPLWRIAAHSAHFKWPVKWLQRFASIKIAQRPAAVSRDAIVWLRHFVAVVSGNRPLKRLRHLLLFAMRNAFPLNSMQSPTQPRTASHQHLHLFIYFVFFFCFARRKASFLVCTQNESKHLPNAKNVRNATKTATKLHKKSGCRK